MFDAHDLLKNNLNSKLPISLEIRVIRLQNLKEFECLKHKISYKKYLGIKVTVSYQFKLLE